eukprot:TRINITY_DN14635_c0_g1_i3.p1 TRINITY_DN14635_c0_g1~~TRINITY_DN14635_c0_g1_i3.p1  ORF type:complete len:455 (+),score=63.69 TRINITY_DN14635_c0_g1_i3:76-1440(+)
MCIRDRHIMEAKTQEQSITKNIFSFLKDFNLLKNNGISKQSIMVILAVLTGSPKAHGALMDPELNCGAVFTLEHFIMLLYWLSILEFNILSKDAMKYSPAEKVYCLLNKMEFSQALGKTSVIPPANVVQTVVKNDPWKLGPSAGNRLLHKKDEQLEEIERLFMAKCMTGKMSLQKYVMLLKECGIIASDPSSSKKSISLTEAELLFWSAVRIPVKSTSSNEPVLVDSKTDERNAKQGRLGFKGFSWSLLQIAAKLYPSNNINKEFDLLYTKHLENIVSQKEDDPRNILAKQEILQVLSMLKNSLGPCVQRYAKSDRKLNYDSFIRFCKDFGIFPEIVGVNFLKKLFSSLILAEKEEREYESRKVREESIGESEVVQALGICALKSPVFASDSNPVFKIIHLAEKMSRSAGMTDMKKVVGTNLDIMKTMKRRYRSYFTLRSPGTEQEELVSKLLN